LFFELLLEEAPCTLVVAVVAVLEAVAVDIFVFFKVGFRFYF
jgi:hypothetical protein